MNFCGDDGLTLDELYALCIKFIREQEGKAFHLSYHDRLQLSAHAKQVVHGRYRPDASPEVGWLDVVGSDRRSRWQALGDLSKEKAQQRFVEILDGASQLLKPYLEAHLNEKLERRRRELAELEEKRRAEQLRLAEEQRRLAEEKRIEEEKRAEEKRIEEEKRAAEEAAAKKESTTKSGRASDQSKRLQQQEQQIRAALNQQTDAQFKQYAAEQHPDDAEKQSELIAQLQDQHFQQYMTQVYQQQVSPESNSEEKAAASATPATEAESTTGLELPAPVANGDSSSSVSMWTHKHLTAEQFKANLASDADAKLKIGAGEVVTVRVPTHEEGNCIVWEFATDYYDIGFGVFFEWKPAHTDKVTVTISDSSDEEKDPEEEAGEEVRVNADSGQLNGDQPAAVDASVDEIVPVYRRDCSSEVYCGSHRYPGRGVYLLKFDNSYSLWRSKWLYYRVYYTK